MTRRSSPSAAPVTLVVIGGGHTGAIVAHQVARRAPGAFRIVVVEPRRTLGGGLAYSTEDPAHRINVPASRMTFLPSDPCHFERWLNNDAAAAEDVGSLTPDGRRFPARAVFGRYAAETLAPYLDDGSIEHRRTTAEGLAAEDERWSVTLATGERIVADIVVIAATHPPPGLPDGLAAVADDPRVFSAAGDGDPLADVATDARVLIVGTGLTMADAVASLERRGHLGPITAVSRRGLLSRGHPDTPGEFGSFAERPARTARALVKNIRRTVAEAEASGRPWQHVLDVVRTQGGAIWAALPTPERLKIVRRLRPFWDVHRFRIAPQVEASIARLRAAGRLAVFAATPVDARADPQGVTVVVRRRGSTAREEIAADAVILATGPAHGSVVRAGGLIGALARSGLVRADPCHLGLAVDGSSRAIGRDGVARPTLLVAGPLAREAFGELMGVPEVTRHAEVVAGEVLAWRRDRAEAPTALAL